MTYILVITLHFLTPYGNYSLPPTQLYTLDECMGVGAITAEWLTQDGVVVTWVCEPQDK